MLLTDLDITNSVKKDIVTLDVSVYDVLAVKVG